MDYNSLLELYKTDKSSTKTKKALNSVIKNSTITKRSEFITVLTIFAQLTDNTESQLYCANIAQQALINSNESNFTFQWDEPIVTKELLTLLDNTKKHYDKINQDSLKRHLITVFSVSLILFSSFYNFVNKDVWYSLLATLFFIVFYFVINYLFENQRQSNKLTKRNITKTDLDLVVFVKNNLKS